jgi:type I site-specific restriction endonuclease
MDVNSIVSILSDYLTYIDDIEKHFCSQVKDQYDAETELLKVVRCIIAIKRHHKIQDMKTIDGSLIIDENADYFKVVKEVIGDYKTKLQLLLNLTSLFEKQEDVITVRETITASLNDISVVGF